jgi:hypothetical protein
MRADNEFHAQRTADLGKAGEKFIMDYKGTLCEADGIRCDLVDILTDEEWEVKVDNYMFKHGMGGRVNVMAETVVATSGRGEVGWVMRFAKMILDGEKLPEYLAFVNLDTEEALVLYLEKFIRHICRTIGIRRGDGGLTYSPDYLERAKNADWLVNHNVTGNSEGEFLLLSLDEVRKEGFVADEIRKKKKIVVQEFDAPREAEENSQDEAEAPKGEPFCHLHVHSQYSLLDGVPTPDAIAEKAASLGHPGIALTDHGYMFGSYKHQQACDKYGIKAVHGFEAYLVEDRMKREDRFNYHITLLAANEQGWKNLIQLNTIAGKEGFFYRPRIDFPLLFKHSEGLIVLSGCFRSPISWHFGMEGRDIDKAVSRMRQFKNVFGDRFYNEVMQIGFEDYDEIVPEMIEVAAAEGIPSVATNDCHYLNHGDDEIQNTLIKIGLGPRRGGDFEFKIDQLYIKSREEMISGPITAEIVDRSLEILDKVNFELKFDGYKFPKFDITQSSDYQQFVEEKKEV